jgi:flagellar hook-associated protein 3 FlgL
MSITGPGSLTATNLLAQNNMSNQLNTLSQELGTGQAATTYSGLQSQAGLAVQLSAQLAAINGYSITASTVGTTLTIAQSALTQLATVGSAVQQAITEQGGFALDNTGQTSTQESAAGYLDQILSLLNTQVGGNYLFSGSAVNQPSVAPSNEILNGNGQQAGLTQVVAERLQADEGVNDTGRLSTAVTGSQLTLSSDGQPFGFQLSGVSSSLTGGSASGPTGSPPTITVNVGANTAAGDTITFDLTLPDGSTQDITLTGTTASPPGTNQFTIGASAGATATNLQTSLNSAITTLAQTALPAASAMAAASNFFEGETQLTSANSVTAALGTAGVTASTQSTNDITAAALAQLSTLGASAYGDTFVFQLGNNPPVTATFGPALNLGTNTFNTAADLINVLNNGGGGNFAGQAVATTDGAGGVVLTSNDLVNNFATTGGTAITSSDVSGANVTNTDLSLGSALTVSDGSNNSTLYWVANNASAANGTFNTAANLVSALNNGASATETQISGAATGAGSAYLTLSNSVGPITVGGTIGAALGFPSGAVDNNANTPLRVAGPPFDTATALVAGTTANTVFWYTGENGAMPALQTATAQVGPSLTISYGMRATEPAITSLLASVGALAATTYSASNTNAQASYQALCANVTQNLSGSSGSQSIDDIEASIADAQTTVQNATTVNTQTQTNLQELLQGFEGVNQTQIGEAILTLQNNLSASMSVTARLAQLSLVNYLAPSSG